MDLAVDQGFKTSGYRGCWGEDVLTRLDEFEARRETFEWPTDGVVIKIDTRPLAQSLGATEHHPKGSIAYKFPAQKAVTRVVSIEISVGATGRRTPVCYLEPVTIMGRTIRQAAIGSEAKMQELGVKEGCLVEVGLSNDVKPYIYRVIDEGGENVKGTPEDVKGTPTDESAHPATARRKPTDRRWLKPLAVAAASVVACVVIYETGLLIPMGLIGLATSGLVK
jgi:NAD-dependent DNA ligase